MIRSNTLGNAEYDEDSLQLIFENLREKDDLLKIFNEKYTKPAKYELRGLLQEPQIAIFGFGDDPEILKEKAKTLSELPELKHASIAVVRMYSWLNLNFVESHKIEHTSRLPIADSFFKAMRLAKKE
jgi:ubiquinone biosynthesis protein Coq4